MTLEVNIQHIDNQPLTPDEEADIVRQLTETWQNGDNALKPSRDRREKVIRAYNAEHELKIQKNKYRSKAYLPWVYRAIESAQARFLNSITPTDEDVFNLEGQTEDDTPGVEMMEKYEKMSFDAMGFNGIMDDAFKNLAFGDVVMKVSWRKDIRQYTTIGPVPTMDESGQPIVDEMGQPLTQQGPMLAEDVLYNNIYFEVINSEDFTFFPINGDLNRATLAYRVWRYIEELEDVPDYQNVEKIRQDMGEGVEGRRGYTGSANETDHLGLEVKEYWVPRLKIKNGRIFKNYIATVVEDKYLIRFEPNPYDYGIRPFVYCPLIKDYNKNTGHGVATRALELQYMGNFTVNQMFDEAKVKLFGYYKYSANDSHFDPAKFLARAGGLIKVGDMNNLQPVNPNIGQLSFGIEQLQYFESQFDLATGIPKFLKGISDFDPKDTATAKRLEAEGADTSFRTMARRVNEYLLKPLVLMGYVLIRQNAIYDPQVLLDIAKKTQETRVQQPVMAQQVDPMTGQVVQVPTGEMQTIELDDEQILSQMPAIPPLSKIDVKVVGFENVLEKQEKAASVERFLTGVGEYGAIDPSVMDWVKSDRMLNNYSRYLKIDDSAIRTQEEFQQYQQQKMQQEQQALQMAQRLGLQQQQPVAA